MATILSWLRLPIFVMGAVLLFVADRYLAVATYHAALRLGAVVMMGLGFLGTLALSFLAAKRGHQAEARGWRCVIWWQVAVLAAVGCYFAYRQMLGDAAVPEAMGAKLLLGAWLTLLTLGIMAGFGLEWAMREGGRGPLAEPQRVARSGGVWLVVGMLLCILFAVNFTADKKDVVRDWSYLKVTSPSEVTEKMLGTLSGEMTIALFYPQGNDVRTLVSQYFDAVGQKEPRIKIVYLDKDMHPTQAETYRISKNGQIVFDFNGKRARIDTGTELSKARKTLKSLDAEFQKSFLEITAEKKMVYFTRGHGESSWVGDNAQNPMKSLGLLEGFLRQQNYAVRLFGVGEGSATSVPDDAAAVIIVGPTQAFQEEEVAALRSYVEAGGNLMVFWDVDRDQGGVSTAGGTDPLLDYLAEAGLKLSSDPLANDKNHVSATRSPADAWFIFSNIFTSHESVASLARHDERIAVLFYQGGSIAVTPETGKWKAFETVRSLPDTFADLNRNFKFDEGSEKRDSYILGAVAEWQGRKAEASAVATQDVKQKNSRIVLFSDATGLSDALVRNPGNAVFFADSLKWLVGESEFAGQIATEEDVRIRHTRNEDVVWFHGTVIVMPLLVLAAGFFATRRRRSGGESRQGEKKDEA